jgi:hypothetical protein
MTLSNSLRYATHRLMVNPMKVIMVCNTPLYLERQQLYGLDKNMLFKKQLFDLEVKDHVHPPTYQIALTYLGRQKGCGLDKKILFKKQLFDLDVKGQGLTKVTTECNTPLYGLAPTY